MTPDFKELELRFVDEATTKLAMLPAGEAHLAGLSHELLPDATGAGMGTAQSARATMQTDIAFNVLFPGGGTDLLPRSATVERHEGFDSMLVERFDAKFDTAWIQDSDFLRQNSLLRYLARNATSLGIQPSFRITGGGSISRNFSRLYASARAMRNTAPAFIVESTLRPTVDPNSSVKWSCRGDRVISR